MVRIALVEDDPGYTAQLLEYLQKYEQASGERFAITQFTDGDEIALGYKASYDIILMDIEMKFMDGMTAAEAIREVDSEVVIIFITNAPQYAIKGYAVDALDYVLKPLSYYAFSQRIDRALKRMKKRARKYISIAVEGGARKVEVSSILYVEVQNHDLILHTADGVVHSTGTMKRLEEAIGSQAFFRCNKCYLVNLEHVNSLREDSAIVAGEAVQVSRARKKALMDALNNYINEVEK